MIFNPHSDVPEMGWTLITAAHGKGYATEALNAALVWAKENFSQDKVVCIISPDNRPSLGLAKKVGFVASHRQRIPPAANGGVIPAAVSSRYLG
ncbi:Acetyltransferase (GNAT) family [Serratia fonticola]|uniref:Acetyltransferase (GNAT) family n=1 Tax=Serratia fonticola TaxID=47917 RepID=A0A4U9TDL2_SERFO|nr:Acetyltransferase (GNAT) family [Serratia fonticola]